MAPKIVDIPLAKLHSFHADENVSRSGPLFADQAEMVSLASDFMGGFSSTQGPNLGAYPLKDDAKKKLAVSEREQELEGIVADRQEYKVRYDLETHTVGTNDRKVAWERCWTVKGKIVTPDHGVWCGHRRSAIMPLVLAAQDKAGLELIQTLPCEVRTFANTLELYLACIAENSKKQRGAKKMSNADIMQAAWKLYCEQGIEQQFRDLWKPGTGQKLFGLCKLNQKAPQCGILDGLLTGGIEFGPISKELLRKINDGIEDGTLDGPALEVADVIASITGKGQNRAKIASRKDIEAASQTPIKVFALVIDAVLKDNLPTLNTYLSKADKINAAWESILADDAS